METIAILGGTGKEGMGLGTRWARAGRRILIGSRDAAKAQDAATKALSDAPGASVDGATNEDAARAADLVVLTIPYAGMEAILSAVRAACAGKIVVDTTVPLRQFAPPVLDAMPAGSAGATAQRLLPDARVVAAFHTVSSAKLHKFGEPVEGDVLVCGDDADAKAKVSELAGLIGMRGIDAGGIDAAAALEQLAAVIIGMNQRYKKKSIGVQFTGI
ncbi:MAG: NADPH-dependent F420 reductase [Armatimonadetes bacterium]|nr:NADPH-dependent F420 reductase [Armatimonadota bacterium]